MFNIKNPIFQYAGNVQILEEKLTLAEKVGTDLNTKSSTDEQRFKKSKDEFDYLKKKFDDLTESFAQLQKDEASKDRTIEEVRPQFVYTFLQQGQNY